MPSQEQQLSYLDEDEDEGGRRPSLRTESLHATKQLIMNVDEIITPDQSPF